ncbi:hypothetical protein BSY239_3398 [Hydrogenophaga sp. RAC07]|uniref:hypothetical protein n=1 Tax=Hydrogenophaga sp. RAC07 TaxID=1842537 RepID=UPI0008574C70|nr:hypothetical protein [Hydrogenophaga sp. RAC07]AOF87462.1 hypothetical protein BSY239_3398 [Hydrogenophaga sp. RAC07]
MKLAAVVGMLLFSGHALAGILPQGGSAYKCQTTGGFFDFSPDNAIASCKKEIDEFCKTKNAPPIVGKVKGEPSGYGVYARAEIDFQCASSEDLARQQKSLADAQSQQIKLDVEASKKTCQEDFGFAQGTTEFGNCLLELQKQIFANRRAENDRATQNEISEAQLVQQRKAASERATTGAIQSLIAPRPSTSINCTTFGSTTNCTSR